MRRLGSILLLALMAGLAPASPAEPRGYAKADICYYGWDVATRAKLSVEDVRRNCRTIIHIVDAAEVRSFVAWLQLDETEPLPESIAMSEDPRLVIDLWDASRHRTTYYAGRHFLVSADGRSGRTIDAAFRQTFAFGRAERESPWVARTHFLYFGW